MNIPRNSYLFPGAFSSHSCPILLSSMLLIYMFNVFKLHRFCLGLMRMYIVLLAFNDSLLAQNHVNQLLISILAWAYSVYKCELDMYKVVSSANDSMFPLHEFDISLTYMRAVDLIWILEEPHI